MRQKLNDNPMLQVAVIAVLLLVGAVFFMSTMKGGGEEEAAEEASVTATVEGATATGATPGEAVEGAVESLEAGVEPAAASPVALPPVKTPERVVRAWDSGATVVLLFVRKGGIDDRIVRQTAKGLASFRGVAEFIVPAADIARYASVTGGVGVERLPALVVLRPKRVDSATPSASVLYGYQTSESIRQAIVDAGYEGPTLAYHP